MIVSMIIIMINQYGSIFTCTSRVTSHIDHNHYNGFMIHSSPDIWCFLQDNNLWLYDFLITCWLSGGLINSPFYTFYGILLVIDHKAMEIMCLVASVHPSVCLCVYTLLFKPFDL